MPSKHWMEATEEERLEIGRQVQKQTDESVLEGFVDRLGLCDVLASVANICNHKATHIRENWQDEQLAANWDRAAYLIDSATVRVRETNPVVFQKD